MTGNAIAAEQLKSIVERIERIDAEIEEKRDDQKGIYAEAKSNGFDCPTIRAIIKMRKQDPAERTEKEAILDVYLNALGMLPLFEHAAE